jgi:pyridinium-3,5-bisthiocarboxylic acid mononucleotide nickel chelatase
MVLGAFFDLGLDPKAVAREINKLKLPEKPVLKVRKGSVQGLSGTVATVQSGKKHKSDHRSFTQIKSMIKRSTLSSFVKEKSIRVFTLIGKIEARIHGVPLEKIHFHEIGAVDSIVDIVGISVCFEMIGPVKTYFSKIPMGSGTVRASHGVLPLPAPATALILKGMPVYGIDSLQELVTPTGAAIAKVFADGFVDLPPMTLQDVGTGLSKTGFKNIPGILRIFLGDQLEAHEHDRVGVVEANIDNMNPEFYGHIQEILFVNGALDVTLTPVIMKKGRPGQIISVICDPAKLKRIESLLLTHTTTIGSRHWFAYRRKLKRDSVKAKTPYGPVMAKRIGYEDGEWLTPEYEDLKKISQKSGIPIQKLYISLTAYLNKN